MSSDTGNTEGGFGSYFTHWRSGKRYYAKDYGYKAWPFGGGGPKKRK